MNINDAMSKSCPFKNDTCSYLCMAWEWINEEDVGGRCMLIPIPEEARGDAIRSEGNEAVQPH